MSGGLRFAPAPPNVSCVICYANNLYPSGPSRYACPRVDTSPRADSLPAVASLLAKRLICGGIPQLTNTILIVNSIVVNLYK